MSGKINVVLYEPEIPQNTGNIMRTCVAFDAKLHIIGPMGFDIDDPRFRRASTNHITWAEYKLYGSYAEFLEKNPDGKYYFMTRYGKKSPSDIDFREAEDREIYLIFGKESTGIPRGILRSNEERCFRIPMSADCRCLNISNACAIVIYEAVKQLGFPGLSCTEVQKGEDFLEKYSYDEALHAPD